MTNTMNRLKLLRQAAGITQQSLADLCGMNITQIQKLESGERKLCNVTLKNAVCIAHFLDVEPNDLLDEEDRIGGTK